MYEVKQNKERVSRTIETPKTLQSQKGEGVFFNDRYTKHSAVIQMEKQLHHVIPCELKDFLFFTHGVTFEGLEGKTVLMEQNGSHPTYTGYVKDAIDSMKKVDQGIIWKFADNLVKQLQTYSDDVTPDFVPKEDIFACIPPEGEAQKQNQITQSGRESSPP